MKKFTFLLVIGSVMSLNVVSAQDSWVQKADFGGGQRYVAVGFSIGNKGYIGTGHDGNVYKKDFWEYDPFTNAWAQKADFGGTARYGAVGFSIGAKGYIGTGNDATGYVKDFWEYDPGTNSWIQKANFGSKPRVFSVGFSIGSKGYIGTGYIANNWKNDFWEYDPAADTWTKKADFGGTPRNGAVGFAIGSKGYLGTGNDGSNLNKDFWEYDPATNAWTQKADFAAGGEGRFLAVGFSNGIKGYIGTGKDEHDVMKNDFWEYDPVSNTWTQKSDFAGIARYTAVSFSIGSYGYIGIGTDDDNIQADFWKYAPDTSACPVPSNLFSTAITSSSVKLKWDTVAGAKKYKLRYKVAFTNDWIILNPVAHHKLLTGLQPNTSYVWQVRTYCKVDSPNLLSPWSSKQEFTTLPYRLSGESSSQPSFQLYPNPAEDHATIQFTLPQSSHVTIKVYEASGKEIKTLLNNQADQGNHTLQLYIKDFSPGIYFVKMISPAVLHDGRDIQKLIVQ